MSFPKGTVHGEFGQIEILDINFRKGSRPQVDGKCHKLLPKEYDSAFQMIFYKHLVEEEKDIIYFEILVINSIN